MTFQAPLPEDGGDSRQCLGTRCVFVLQKHAAECRMCGGAVEGQRLNIPFFCVCGIDGVAQAVALVFMI